MSTAAGSLIAIMAAALGSAPVGSFAPPQVIEVTKSTNGVDASFVLFCALTITAKGPRATTLVQTNT